MTSREGLLKLKEFSLRLDTVEYDDIIKVFKESIKKIPIPLARLLPNTNIDRVRKNISEDYFTNVHEQLSYIKDQYIIDHYLNEFGRANKPHQPMFYGAIESTLVETQRITALAETSELLQDPNGVNFNGELYTISRWKNSIELSLVEMVFCQEAIDINPDIKKSFEKQVEFLKQAGAEDIDFYKEFLVFISEEFAKPKTLHHDYKISTAYTNLALSKNNSHGITYPSVRTKYEGQNIVLTPSVVDNYLNVEVLSIQRLYKNKMITCLNNVKNCINPKDCLTNIIWSDTDPQYVASKEKIYHSLMFTN